MSMMKTFLQSALDSQQVGQLILQHMALKWIIHDPAPHSH